MSTCVTPFTTNIRGALVSVPSYCHALWCLPCSIWLGPAQDFQFFYTCSHLRALQSCALIYQLFFSLFNYCLTQFSHWVFSCTRNITIFTVIYQCFVQFCSLFKYWPFNNSKFRFYCASELLFFWKNDLYALSRKGCI